MFISVKIKNIEDGQKSENEICAFYDDFTVWAQKTPDCQ